MGWGAPGVAKRRVGTGVICGVQTCARFRQSRGSWDRWTPAGQGAMSGVLLRTCRVPMARQPLAYRSSRWWGDDVR